MHTVRTHTRHTASGGATTVRQHSATGGGRPRLTVARTRSGRVLATGMAALLPARDNKKKSGSRNLARRSWGNVKRSFKAAGRDKWTLAAGYGGLATAQLAGFLTLRGVAYAALAAGVLAVGVGLAARKAAA